MQNKNTGILPLQLCNLSYRVGEHQLLHHIDLHIPTGPLTIILGANGAGKTLLLKMCCGLIKPERGEVQWQRSEAPNGLPAYTLVFHKPVLLRRSVLDNILFALHPLDKDEQQLRARQALTWAGCEELADRLATKLSSGQQQLVSLARAWALQPQVLFLDEPCANLDPEASLRLEQLIRELHRQGTKIVMTTHNLAQAQRLADEIIFIEKGRIAEQTAAKAFFQRPSCDSAQRFLALQGLVANTNS